MPIIVFTPFLTIPLTGAVHYTLNIKCNDEFQQDINRQCMNPYTGYGKSVRKLKGERKCGITKVYPLTMMLMEMAEYFFSV